MDEKEKEKLSLSIYHIVLSVRNNIALPTHGTIAKVLVLAISMLFCSVVSTLLRFYTFVSWQGCLLCVIVLLVLLWVERAQNDTLIKAYRTGAAALKRAETLTKGRTIPKNKTTKKGGTS